MLRRQPRSRLDLLKPDLAVAIQKKQDKQKLAHDKTALHRSFCVREEVYSKNYSGSGSLWLFGHIVKFTGPVSAEIEFENGSQIWCHFDQLRHWAPVKPFSGTHQWKMIFSNIWFWCHPWCDLEHHCSDGSEQTSRTSDCLQAPRRNPPHIQRPPDKLTF